MSTTETADFTDQQLFMLEDFEFEIPCDSQSKKHREQYPDTHAADWIILSSCGHLSNWCNPRLTQYVQDQILGPGTHCSQCGADPISVIRTAPLHG